MTHSTNHILQLVCQLFRYLYSTSVGHGRLDDVQCWVVLTQVIGHVPVRVNGQQIGTTGR